MAADDCAGGKQNMVSSSRASRRFHWITATTTIIIPLFFSWERLLLWNESTRPESRLVVYMFCGIISIIRQDFPRPSNGDWMNVFVFIARICSTPHNNEFNFISLRLGYMDGGASHGNWSLQEKGVADCLAEDHRVYYNLMPLQVQAITTIMVDVAVIKNSNPTFVDKFQNN